MTEPTSSVHPAFDSTATATATRDVREPARGGVRGALRLVGAVLVLSAACVVPSRALLALEQGRSVSARALYFAGGLVSDLAIVGPFVALVMVVGLTIVRRSRSTRGRASLGLLFVLLLVAVSLVHNAATLFRVERGVFPGPIDAREGLGAFDSWTSELPAIVSGRFLLANLLALATVVQVVRKTCPSFLRSERASRPRMMVATFAFALVFGALGVMSAKANAYCVKLHNGGAVSSPASAWLPELFGRPRVDGSPADVRRLVATASGTPQEVTRGAAALGFSPEAAAKVLANETHPTCDAHPLARPLDDDGTPLVVAAHDLSRALLGGRDEPLVVYQVSLESFRADDINALEPLAPREIAPYLSRLYEGDPSAATFRRAHQSGIRTAHALAAVQCGVGILPFHLALGRDLGNVPLRCLPDVLSDAGFRTRIVYGHELAFDDMGTFLKFHGVELHERDDMPRDAPRGVWGGLSDGPVYDAALGLAADDIGASYNFVLTLSHHTPYTAPGDLAPELRAEVDGVCTARGLHGENCARLHTARYADAMLERFVSRIEGSKAAARTLVVVAADHTTHQWVPWTGAEKPDGIARIPMALVIPRAMREAARDREKFEASWASFRALAKTAPVSNTDLPTLVLSWLASSRALRELPEQARWHTLGAQATSTSFAPPVGEGALFGVDAHAQLFTVAATGEIRPTGIGTDTLRTRDDVTAPSDRDRATLAFLGSFLRGYGSKCRPGASSAAIPTAGSASAHGAP